MKHPAVFAGPCFAEVRGAVHSARCHPYKFQKAWASRATLLRPMSCQRGLGIGAAVLLFGAGALLPFPFSIMATVAAVALFVASFFAGHRVYVDFHREAVFSAGEWVPLHKFSKVTVGPGLAGEHEVALDGDVRLVLVRLRSPARALGRANRVGRVMGLQVEAAEVPPVSQTQSFELGRSRIPGLLLVAFVPWVLIGLIPEEWDWAAPYAIGSAVAATATIVHFALSFQRVRGFDPIRRVLFEWWGIGSPWRRRELPVSAFSELNIRTEMRDVGHPECPIDVQVYMVELRLADEPGAKPYRLSEFNRSQDATRFAEYVSAMLKLPVVSLQG